ncbi:MAG: helix-turn-helix domain-containing protein [Oscillospiraceae bacterium]|nr:helix-turn-helix domain-containing protein [Oscillospiraceae bacterium]
MSIINNLLSILEKKGYRQTDLCEAIGISSSTMTNWKNRGTDPPAKYIIPICEFLNVSPYLLLTGKENEKTTLTSDSQELLEIYGKLADEKKREAIRRVEELTTSAEIENKMTFSHNGISRTNGYEQELILNFRKLSLEEQMRLIGRVEVMAEMSEAKEKIG